MATALYPLEDTLNLHRNLEALFTSIDMRPGENGKAGNFDGKIFDESLNAGVSLVLFHGLNRMPVGVVVLAQDQHGSIRTITSSERLVVVEASANMTARLLIL